MGLIAPVNLSLCCNSGTFLIYSMTYLWVRGPFCRMRALMNLILCLVSAWEARYRMRSLLSFVFLFYDVFAPLLLYLLSLSIKKGSLLYYLCKDSTSEMDIPSLLLISLNFILYSFGMLFFLSYSANSILSLSIISGVMAVLFLTRWLMNVPLPMRGILLMLEA